MHLLPIKVGNTEFIMMPVAGGPFLMGSPNGDGDAYDNEKPQHQVTVPDFYLGKVPVTQALWRAVMRGTKLAAPAYFKGDELPVETVSWLDITDEFLPRLRDISGLPFRLPTEAEWEFAGRGGLRSCGFKYAGSDRLRDVGWYDYNSKSQTQPVGQKDANELGLHDMSGNVYEWCEDDWHGSYNGNPPTDGSAWIDRPQRGSARVLRGGYWYDAARNCRVANRNGNTPDYRHLSLGFRLALPSQSVGLPSAHL